MVFAFKMNETLRLSPIQVGEMSQTVQIPNAAENTIS